MTAILEHRVLYGDARYYASFPGLVTTDAGPLVVFRRGRDQRWLIPEDDAPEHDVFLRRVDHVDPRSHLCRLWLDGDGRPQGEPLPLSTTIDAGDQDASLLRLADGSLLLASFSWAPCSPVHEAAIRRRGGHFSGSAATTGCLFLFWGSYLRLSRDSGQTFTPHQYLPPLPHHPPVIPGRLPYRGGGLRGQPVEVDGEVLFATYGRCGATGVATAGAHLWRWTRTDETPRYGGVVAHDGSGELHLQEPSLCHLADGRLRAYLRTGGGTDHIATCVSSDGGHSWSPYELMDRRGHPPHPLKLADGRIFLTYGYRHAPYGVRGQLLAPDGCTPLGDEVVLRDDAAFADVGYPWSAVVGGDDERPRVLVVYYFPTASGRRIIASTLVDID